jgi:hypothetical protein
MPLGRLSWARSGARLTRLAAMTRPDALFSTEIQARPTGAHPEAKTVCPYKGVMRCLYRAGMARWRPLAGMWGGDVGQGRGGRDPGARILAGMLPHREVCRRVRAGDRATAPPPECPRGPEFEPPRHIWDFYEPPPASGSIFYAPRDNSPLPSKGQRRGQGGSFCRSIAASGPHLARTMHVGRDPVGGRDRVLRPVHRLRVWL